ncbi:flavin reductase family protein [Saccharopolyspora sp. TS4A08]|uniref:Flavin reductase family protein n=1 Tax=Saccharopolyspora ipomoeae TaxID=3042027 RepID=A0ABT6PJS7_9PSEU|nr:flavin reductase family protein [Saccharopolyspora sp. TS4A08]MDI2028228.1 flavin reductase family protein [Saccharopolyspora sp. TS4A08]
METSERARSEFRGPISPQRLREVVGSFCSGVVVVSAVGSDGPIGLTCQSFASLSLEPPLVTFAVARTSRTWPRIRDVGSFCVNILAADQRELSQQFSRSGADKFAGVEWSPSPLGAPVLDGVVAWIDCELRHEYDGGDHTIVIGEVHDLAGTGERRPLLFHRGDYLDIPGTTA